MKKLIAFGAVACVGATMAFASSIGVPWFVDNADPGTGLPPTSKTTSVIFLHNNLGTDVECAITYYSSVGDVFVPSPNTFIIPALSSVAFRPVAADPGPLVVGGSNLGQESPVGLAVPDRPLTDGKKNGSCSISWSGGPNDIQGQITTWSTLGAGAEGNRLGNNQPLISSYSHLLPPGS